MRTSFHHQSEAQPPNGPLTAATSPIPHLSAPPRTEYLTCLVFLTFLLCKFFRQFRDFAPIEQ